MTTLETCEDGHEAIAFARERQPADMGNTCPLCAMREALSDAKEALSDAEGAFEDIESADDLAEAVDVARTARTDVRWAVRDAEALT